MHFDKNKITITGHRGAAGLAPENTIAAIRKGMKYADRIEIDVHQSKDGKIVVMHDSYVNRTTDGIGFIKNMNWSEISKLDAGSWFSKKYQGEKVPLLEEVIDLVCDKKILLIEIKEGEYPNIEENIINTIREKKVMKQIIIQSFSDKILQKIHSLEPEIKLHKLFIKNISFFGISIMISNIIEIFHKKQQNYIDEYSIYHRFITKYFMYFFDKKTGNKMVNVWVENNPKKVKNLIQKGIDGIITDYPNRF